MFICRNAEGVHDQRKVGDPCIKPIWMENTEFLITCCAVSGS